MAMTTRPPDTDDGDDAVLLARFADERSEAAFAAVVARHAPMVLATCRRVAGNAADAEDAAQAAFLVLARRAAELRSQPTIAPWLHQVARHTALKAREARARRTAHEREAAMTHETTGTANDESQAWAELAPHLDRELAALPERYRAPLVLFHLEGRSLAETAARLRRPVGTVGSLLARGRALLRERLARAAAVAGALDDAALERGLRRDLAAVALPATLLALPASALGASAAPATVVALADAAPAVPIATGTSVGGLLASLGIAGAAAAVTIGLATMRADRQPPTPPAPIPVAAPASDPALGGEGLTHPSWEVRLAAVKGLALRHHRIDRERADALVRDEAWPVRAAFIGAAPDLDLPAGVALEAARRGFDDASWPVREAAAETAGTIGVPAAGLAASLRALAATDGRPGSTARWALSHVVPQPEAGLAEAAAARVADLRATLGAEWSVTHDGTGLVVASAPEVPAEALGDALAAATGTRRVYGFLTPGQAGFTRPVTLVLVAGAQALADGVSGVHPTGGNGFDPRTRSGLADATGGPGYTTWVLLSALWHQRIGWDERGVTRDGVGLPAWLQIGIADATFSTALRRPDGGTVDDLRREQTLAWLERAGLVQGRALPDLLAEVPEDAATPSLRWLLALDEERYETSRQAAGQLSECFGRSVVRWLQAQDRLEPFVAALQARLDAYRSRTARAWALAPAASSALAEACGAPLPELERRLFDWIRAGEPVDAPALPAATSASGAEF